MLRICLLYVQSRYYPWFSPVSYPPNFKKFRQSPTSLHLQTSLFCAASRSDLLTPKKHNSTLSAPSCEVSEQKACPVRDQDYELLASSPWFLAPTCKMLGTIPRACCRSVRAASIIIAKEEHECASTFQVTFHACTNPRKMRFMQQEWLHRKRTAGTV